jgi:hypothetical protein
MYKFNKRYGAIEGFGLSQIKARLNNIKGEIKIIQKCRHLTIKVPALCPKLNLFPISIISSS